GEHARCLVHPAGDHLGKVFVAAHTHHGDEIHLAGDRVDLADPFDVGDRRSDLGDAVDVGLDHDDRGDHCASRAGRYGTVHTSASTPRSCFLDHSALAATTLPLAAPISLGQPNPG